MLMGELVQQVELTIYVKTETIWSLALNPCHQNLINANAGLQI